jgi:hypothetical protein
MDRRKHREWLLMGVGVILAGALVASAGLVVSAGKAVPAFPGAEGFGARTPGGRGGKVLMSQPERLGPAASAKPVTLRRHRGFEVSA